MELVRAVLCLLFLAHFGATVEERFIVEENRDSSTPVGSVRKDGGSEYSFQENDGFFTIDSSGTIRCNGTLDRERVVGLYGEDLLTYTINYLSREGKASFNIHIQVEDVNDNAPEFHIPASVAVLSNQVGPVWQLQATDPDRGENATVDFAIRGGNEDGFFELQAPAEGDVVTRTHDRLSLTKNPPTGQFFLLELTASDRGTPEPKSTTVTLRVNISAAASDVPVFTHSRYQFSVPTTAVRGDTVGAVSAMDPDSLVNSTIVYYLDETHFAFAKANKSFSVDRESGQILLKEVPLSPERISFVVIAENTHSVVGAELRAWTQVNVEFIQPNPPPQILMVDGSSIPPLVNLSENNVPPSPLLSVIVRFSGSLSNTSVELSPYVNHSFTNRQIGIFSVYMFSITESIDREMVPLINVTLFAVGSGGEKGSESTTVIILDENDNYPMFELSEYRKNVEETLGVGNEILRVSASDPDFGANGTISYNITNISPLEAADLLHINPSTGAIVLDSRLNYEDSSLRTIMLRVNGSDGGSPPKRASTSVIVTVHDVNEAPVFVPDPPTAVDIFYNMSSQAHLASFTAQDDDVSDEVSYSVSCPTVEPKFLDINSQSGDLKLLHLPDPPPNDTILCTIIAKDSQSHSTELNVTVYYIADECSGNPCSNNASCDNGREGFSCTCPATHTGRRCAIPVDPCYKSPCTNGGTCTGTANSHQYTCRCPPGFAGHNCEVSPVSFNRSGFSKYSVPSSLSSAKLDLALEFSTASSYGLIYYLQIGVERFVSLEIVDERVQLTSSRTSDPVRSAKVEATGQWYRVEVNEEIGRLSVVKLDELSVKTNISDSNDGNAEMVFIVISVKIRMGTPVMSSELRDLDCVGTLASSAFHALGGVPDIRNVPNKLSAYDFVGCIGHVVVNGYLLDVAMPTKSHALESDCVKPTAPTKLSLLTQSCVLCNGVDADVCDYVVRRLPQSCSQAYSTAQSYVGSGYSRIRLKNDFFLYTEVLRRGEEPEQTSTGTAVSLLDPQFEISLHFASGRDGILWAAIHGDNYHVLSLSSGQLTYIIFHSGKFRLLTLRHQYSDDQWHSVKVIQTTEKVMLQTDREEDGFHPTPAPGIILTNNISELQVGGVSQEMAAFINATAEEYQLTPQYSGCLMNLTINHLLIPLDARIEGVTEVELESNTFGNNVICPSLGPTGTNQVEFILMVATPPAALLLMIVCLVLIVCFVCVRCRRRRSKFDIKRSSSDLGNEPTSMVSYNDEVGEFHPDEDEDKKKHMNGGIFHITQASIDSPTVMASQRTHFPALCNVSQETGFHSDMQVPGGSSTDIKDSDNSDADESNFNQSDNEGRIQTRHPAKRLSRTKRKQTRQRHESLTSTEERVLDPVHLRESRVLSPSIEDHLDTLDSMPKMVRPSAPLPLSPPTYQGEEHRLKSLSAAHVTPISYWEEAYRMKPAVDTDEQSLRLSQLINEPYWVMESPSPCTSVVSSAFEDGRLFSRHHTFNSQGGVEDEAGVDSISMGTDDSINRYARNSSRQRTPNFNTPPFHKYYQGRGHFSGRGAMPFQLHHPLGPPHRDHLYPHQELPQFRPMSPRHFTTDTHSPLGYLSSGKGSGRSTPRKLPANAPSPLKEFSQESPGSPGHIQQPEFSPMKHNFRNPNALAMSPKVSLAQLANGDVANGDVEGHMRLPEQVSNTHRPSSQPLLDEGESFDRLQPYHHFHQTASLDRCLSNSTKPPKGEPQGTVDV